MSAARASPTREDYARTLPGRVQYAYAHSRGALLAALLTVPAVWLVAWRFVDSPALVEWSLAMFAAYVVRVGVDRLHARALERAAGYDARRWLRTLCVVALATGTAWGLLAVQAIPIERRVMLFAAITVLVAVAAVAARALSVVPAAYACFAGAMLLPVVATQAAGGDPGSPAIAITVFIFLVAMLAGAFGSCAEFTRRLLLQGELVDLSGRHAVVRERMQRAVDGSGAVLWDTDLATRRVTLGEGWSRLLRAGTPGEVTSTVEELAALVHADDLAEVVRLQVETIRGQREEYATEHRVRAADGEWRWVLSRGRVTARDPATGRALRMSGTNLDVTALHAARERLQRETQDRERASAALGETQRLMASVLATTQEGFWFVGPDGRTRDVNPAMCGLLGRSRDAIVGAALQDLLESRDAADLARVFAAGQPGAFEVALRRPDGAPQPCLCSVSPLVDAAGRPAGAVGFFTDIRARKETERALLASEQRYRALSQDLEGLVEERTRALEERTRALGERTRALSEREALLKLVTENVPIALAYFDGAGTCRFANARYAATLGRAAAADVVGQPYAALLSGGRAERFAAVEARIRAGEAARYESVSAEEPPRSLETLLVPDSDTAGRPRGLFAVVVDVTERKAAEQVLRDSQSYLQALLDVVPEGIVVHEQGIVRYANREALRVIGARSPGEFIGRDIGQFASARDLARVRERLAEVEASERTSPPQLFRLARLDGSEIEVETSSALVRQGGRTAFLTVCRDTRERRQREQALSHLAAIVETSSDAIITRTPEGRILTWNRGAERIFGYQADEAVGRDVGIISAPAHADDWRRNTAMLASGLGILPFETVRRRKDGRDVDVQISVAAIRDAAGTVTAVAAIFRDISERKRAERAVRESEARLRGVLDAVPTSIFCKDRDGRYLMCNRANAALYGLAPEQMIGQTVRSAGMPEESAREVDEADRRVRVTGEIQVIPEFRMRDREGRERTFINVRIPFRFSEEHPDAVLGLVTDVTERRALEEQLRESQKMEAVGTLAGGIAHDFNNILGVILGNVGLARKDAAGQEKVLESLEEIGRAGEQAKRLVQQILAFSRRQPQEMKVRELAPVVREALGLLRAMVPAVVTLDERLGERAVYARVDETQVGQVLMNLCTNAWQAMGGSTGRIEVGLGQEALGEGRAKGLGLGAGRYACLSVADDGPGMDEATQARIFEPFFTTKAGKGTGLGLAVVHGIVKGHGGAIGVASVPGRGTRFEVWLPAVAAPPAQGAQPAIAGMPAAEASARVALRGRRVLYVDDNAGMVLLVARLLEDEGYEVRAYESAAEALAAVRAAPGVFDVVVTDYNMPGMSGLELASELRRISPALPVVITTGFITDALVDGARAEGVRKVIHKPDTFTELGDAIRAALAAL